MLKLINYGNRSIAVVGDTYAHRNSFKAIGGRFSREVAKPEGGFEPGWTFPKDREDDVRRVIQEITGSSPPAEQTPSAPVIPMAQRGQRVSDGGLTEVVKRLQEKVAILERRIAALEGGKGSEKVRRVRKQRPRTPPEPLDDEEEDRPRPRLLKLN